MKPRARWTLVALALACACAFALSVWVGAWWRMGECNVGPFGARGCVGNGVHSLAWLGGGDIWMRSAIATGVAGLVAMIIAIAVAGALAAKRMPKLISRSLIAAVATATVVGAYFFVKCPQLAGADTHLGLGLPLYIVGIVLGAIAAITVQRAR